MFCSKCGKQIQDGTKFCPNCGAAANGNPTPQQARPVQQPMPNPAVQTAAVPPQAQPIPNAPRPRKMYELVWINIKKMLSAPVFIITVVLFTLSILLSFTGGSFLNTILSSMGSVISLMGLDSWETQYYLSEVMDGLGSLIGSSGTIINILTNLPSILIAIGLWLLVAAGFNKTHLKTPTTGLTMIQVIVILQFIGALLPVLPLIAGAFILGEYSTKVLVIMLLIAVVLLVFVLLYYIKLLKTIGAIKDALISGTPNASISTFIIFMCFAGGIISAITSLTSLSGLCGAVSTIMFGYLLHAYKAKIVYLLNNGRRELAPEAPNMQVPGNVPANTGYTNPGTPVNNNTNTPE